MDLHKEDLPATLQAFDLQNNNEIFLAEQQVNNQAEIEMFTSRYAGKLIKAKTLVTDNNRRPQTQGNAVVKKPAASTGIIMIIVILVIAALIIYGFSTGWLQEKLNLKI